jgi:hypothetical protein
MNLRHSPSAPFVASSRAIIASSTSAAPIGDAISSPNPVLALGHTSQVEPSARLVSALPLPFAHALALPLPLLPPRLRTHHNHHVKLLRPRNKLHRRVVHNHRVELDARVAVFLLGDALARVEEQTVAELHDVGLVDAGDFL